MIVGIDPSGEAPVSGVESELVGPEFRTRSEVPFPEQPRVITSVSKGTGECGISIREYGGIGRLRGMFSEMTGVFSGQKRSPSRRAYRADVMMGQLKSGGRQVVERRCLDGRSVPTDIAPAKVVGNYEEDIRFDCAHSGLNGGGISPPFGSG